MHQGNESRMRIDCLYCRSLPAILKIIQAIASLLGFICLQHITMIDCNSCVELLQTVCMGGFLFSALFLILYFFHVIGSIGRVPWLGIEIVLCILWMIFDLATATHLAVSLTTCTNCYFGATATFGFALLFGYVATIAYGCDAAVKLFRFIKKMPAQQ